MLVLSRKKGEQLVIGEPPNEIRLHIVEIDRGKVRLGVEADRQVPVYREEIHRLRQQTLERTEAIVASHSRPDIELGNSSGG